MANERLQTLLLSQKTKISPRDWRILQLLAKEEQDRKRQLELKAALEKAQKEIVAKVDYVLSRELEFEQKRMEAAIWSIDDSVCYLRPTTGEASFLPEIDLLHTMRQAFKHKIIHLPFRDIIKQIKTLEREEDQDEEEIGDTSLEVINTTSSGYSSPREDSPIPNNVKCGDKSLQLRLNNLDQQSRELQKIDQSSSSSPTYKSSSNRKIGSGRFVRKPFC